MRRITCPSCGYFQEYTYYRPTRCNMCMEELKMSKLGDQQREFAKAFPLLLLYAFALGYEVTFPPEHTNHIKKSFHFDGRAKDINLFRDGRYLIKTEDHLQLGLFWESLGGSWGGRWDDGNHYSWGEGR